MMDDPSKTISDTVKNNDASLGCLWVVVILVAIYSCATSGDSEKEIRNLRNRVEKLERDVRWIDR